MTDRGQSEPNLHLVFEGAWQRMVQCLFQPFRWQCWLWLGLCAWLTYFGEGGGGGWLNFRLPGGEAWQPTASESPSPGTLGEASAVANRLPAILEAATAQLKAVFTGAKRGLVMIIVAGVVILLALMLAASLIMSWVKGRFEFIFLDNLRSGREDLAESWRRYAAEGWSLFLWRLVFQLVTIATIVPLLGLCLGLPLWLAWPSFQAGQLLPAGITALILGAGLILGGLIPVSIAFSVVSWLVRHFIVQIMLRRGGTVTAAWRVLLPLLRHQPKAFASFALLFLGLNVAAGIIGLAVLLGTCCLCCLGLIPGLGGLLMAIVTLPIPVFLRFFSAEFFAQFGPAYTVFPANPASPGSAASAPAG